MSAGQQTETVEIDDVDDELKQELEDIKYATRDDGKVEAVVETIERTSTDRIRVEVALPSGKTVVERMPMPERATDEYKFVRLCQQNGASIDTYDDLLVGSTVPVDSDNGEWDIHAPRQPSLRDRVQESIDQVRDRREGVGETRFGIRVYAAIYLFYPFFIIIAAGNWLAGWRDINRDAAHIDRGILISTAWWLSAIVTFAVFYFAL